jgi:hypothetical protein
VYHYSWKDQALHQLRGLSKTVALTIADKVKNYLTQEPRGNNSNILDFGDIELVITVLPM